MLMKAWITYWDDPEDGERRYRITKEGLEALRGWASFKLQQDEMLNQEWDENTDLDVQMAFLVALIIPTIREILEMWEESEIEREQE